jgi:hypothetical protein
VVTDRDRSVVEWVASIGAVSAQDVMARFGVGRTAGYRRLRTLVDHALLTRERLVRGARGAATTKRGATTPHPPIRRRFGLDESGGRNQVEARRASLRWSAGWWRTGGVDERGALAMKQR